VNESILVIDDEPGLRITLSDRLQSEGYRVQAAADGEAGFRLALDSDPDLIILDIMLPVRSGLDVCRDLRSHRARAPILMLTAKDQTVDKIVGLKLGADDYLTKPFDMLELLARVEALLRRSGSPDGAPAARLKFGPFSINARRMEVLHGEKRIQLSTKTYQLLCYFVEHRDEVLSRERLLEDVWGYNAVPNTRTVDVHVAWLRQKIEEDPANPRWILTEHGRGYRFAG
jgi:two-component system, OmpR family, alkaline phosphatase synthesis response regulator PhoP